MARVRMSLGQVTRKSTSTFCYVAANGDVMERERGAPKSEAKKIGHVTRSGARLAWVDGKGLVFGTK